MIGFRVNFAPTSMISFITSGMTNFWEIRFVIRLGPAAPTTYSMGESTVTMGFDGSGTCGLYLVNNRVTNATQNLVAIDTSGCLLIIDKNHVSLFTEPNDASGATLRIGPGNMLNSNAHFATISGGRNNQASGRYATVIGGSSNDASGVYSIAMGRRAQALHPYSLVVGLSGSTVTSQGSSTVTIDASGGLYLINNPSGSGMPLEITAGGQVVTGSSSRRFKQNILDLSNELTDRLNSLRSVSFNRIHSERTDYGLIAEEVDGVIPEVVEHDASGLPYGIRYLSLIALLIKSAQQQRAKTTQLETEMLKQIALLEARIKNLES